MNLDTVIIEIDRALRTVAGVGEAARDVPGLAGDAALPQLDGVEQRRAAGLMRVNHVGEVCAQALYQAQALASTRPEVRAGFLDAARDETDHLAWTAQRLKELGSRPSLLNPFWYAGAYALGLLAGKAGDKVSLGLVVETERQVEQHLAKHLIDLPAADLRSRAIVEQMRRDEIRHGESALAQGALQLPEPARAAMRVAAKVMTTTAYWV